MDQSPGRIKNRTLTDILTEDYRRARVFRNNDIDFCCGGNRVLKEVCDEHNLNMESVVRQLIDVTDDEDTSHETFEEMNTIELIDRVQEQHHNFTEDAIARISGYLDKVRRVHGKNHPEIIELAEIWVEMGPEMLQHMQREDRVLFPYAKNLFRDDRNPEDLEPPQDRTAEELIESMEGEHDETGDRLYTIKDLTDDFTPPDDACSTFRALYSDLEEFVDVTMEHVFIENSILFPRIISREEDVFWSTDFATDSTSH